MMFLGINAKDTVASLFSILHLDVLGLSAQRAFLAPFIRAVNYHDVPPFQAEAFEAQLIYFKQNFEVVGPAGLNLMASGQWGQRRPGLILSFDDGLRSHADVVAPLLERHGLTGWFMVPGGFIDAPPEKQALYAQESTIEYYEHDYGDPRIAMTWADIGRMAELHEIGCHTWSHTRLVDTLSEDDLDFEILNAKRRLEVALGRPVSTFCWVGGEEFTYSQSAARAIARAGFRFSFMSNNQVIRPSANLLQLQRTNIEARNPEKIVRFQLSGAMDLMYWPKRKRVNRVTRTDPEKIAVAR
jgi:peptidoglycan/xylan/chitin deacetylase (PgdA/CDA1 family)